MYCMKRRKKRTTHPNGFLIGWFLVGIFAANPTYAQHSPQQPFKGHIGKTLEESVPYKITYNKKAAPGSPNIVWILIDDAGFGATSAFGGLVETPNIEKLANNGLRFSNFHTTGICSPTRASLLTGRNHHSVHMGMLTPATKDFPGYDTWMPFEKANVAEILRENGYNTFAVGKWHQTPVVENGQAGPFNRWPLGRGFDHFYGFLPGATDQWHPELWEDQTKLDIEPNADHLNKLLADKAIKYISNQKSVDPEKPFFLYLATGATHAPHQVAKEWIDKYRGKFDMGWDKYRELVLEKQKKLGVVPANATLPPRGQDVKAWESLTAKEKKASAKFMEVYAAFYSYTDYEIGRVINYLEQIDQLENTLIFVVLGDNGASKAGAQTGNLNGEINQLKGEEKLDAILAAGDIMGTDLSHMDYPKGWAMAANTPFQYWKSDANAEGGTHNPLIVYYPKAIKDKGGVRNQYGHVMDVLPTTLELIHAEYPDTINGYPQEPIEGVSLADALQHADAPDKHKVQYYEISGSRAIYRDGWKAETWHKPGGNFDQDVWELYHLSNDFNEQVDLSAKYPDTLKALQNLFDQQAWKYNVYPLKDFTSARLAQNRSVYSKVSQLTLYPGVDNLVGVSTPVYNGKSFDVVAEASIITGKEQGVLFAIGGIKSGISLFIQDGKLQYAHKVDDQVQYLVADKVLPKGRVRFKLAYRVNGAGKGRTGTETLYINDEKVGERNLSDGQLQIVSENRVDGTDVGRDLHAAVADKYQSPFNFSGNLHKVSVNFLKSKDAAASANADTEE
ncbi:arylsulfatase [Olivibacter ginsenosidimutans]|uniref:Arylsulfatase n=2 Tax=Olivibacter ginsenosidimutans TaxID=1176537 RepID=A0ABP9BZ21_9SPHI